MRRVAAMLVFAAAPAMAHGDEVHAAIPPWTLDPWLVTPLLLLLGMFLLGTARLKRRSTVDRRTSMAFIAGWLVLSLALVSPLHAGGERSFTLHMIEHELIMLVATLLLAASHAGGVLAWGLPKPLRSALGGSWKSLLASLWKELSQPVTATLVQGVVMWAWHAPALFDRALDNPWIHIAQHASFVMASLLFWSAMLNPRRGGYGLAALCLFATSLIGGALGALMAVSTSPWYAGYAAMPLTGIGLDPVTDQQLAGLLMWIPGGLVHAGAAVIFLYRWLSGAEKSDALAIR